MVTQALVLLAHGSRDARWREPIEAVAARVAALRPQVTVRCAYLEACEPSLPAAVDQIVSLGISAICVQPLFLGMGRHAREDIPRLVEALIMRHPGQRIWLARPASEDPALADCLARIALGSLGNLT